MLTFRNQEQFVIDFGLTDIVRDWADDDAGDAESIRIDVTRIHAEDEWGLDWKRPDQIIQRMRAEKCKHAEAIRRCTGVDRRNGVRLFVFGELPRRR
jgi:hypothetical protein